MCDILRLKPVLHGNVRIFKHKLPWLCFCRDFLAVNWPYAPSQLFHLKERGQMWEQQYYKWNNYHTIIKHSVSLALIQTISSHSGLSRNPVFISDWSSGIPVYSVSIAERIAVTPLADTMGPSLLRSLHAITTVCTARSVDLATNPTFDIHVEAQTVDYTVQWWR